MSSGPNAQDVFGMAIREHLEVVRQLKQQLGVLVEIAHAMTATL